jgi:hypothetical protein
VIEAMLRKATAPAAAGSPQAPPTSTGPFGAPGRSSCLCEFPNSGRRRGYSADCR